MKFASYACFLPPGVPLNPAKRATPEFCRDFIRAYLQRKLQLEGKPEDSLTETEVEKYYVWTCKCCLVSAVRPERKMYDQGQVAWGKADFHWCLVSTLQNLQTSVCGKISPTWDQSSQLLTFFFATQGPQIVRPLGSVLLNYTVHNWPQSSSRPEVPRDSDCTNCTTKASALRNSETKKILHISVFFC